MQGRGQCQCQKHHHQGRKRSSQEMTPTTAKVFWIRWVPSSRRRLLRWRRHWTRKTNNKIGKEVYKESYKVIRLQQRRASREHSLRWLKMNMVRLRNSLLLYRNQTLMEAMIAQEEARIVVLQEKTLEELVASWLLQNHRVKCLSHQFRSIVQGAKSLSPNRLTSLKIAAAKHTAWTRRTQESIFDSQDNSKKLSHLLPVTQGLV